MDFSHYSDRPARVAVDLVNTLNPVSGRDALATPEDVAGFIDDELGDWDEVTFIPTERHLHEARALRSRLRGVWEARDENEAADILNHILADVSATPSVSIHGKAGPHLHFEPRTGGPIKWLGAVTAMGLSVALIEGGWERFGICASESCDDVYIDHSKNRSRRHCSDTCTTRESVAAYRRRQKAGAA
ncbi:MAG: zf-CGNR multi-domain protein [Actinobacteria bacterium]|nr:MAG: zf-CGNR multi-domain protein [Actinomycetota bacterium]